MATYQIRRQDDRGRVHVVSEHHTLAAAVSALSVREAECRRERRGVPRLMLGYVWDTARDVEAETWRDAHGVLHAR